MPPISRALRKYVSERANYRCGYCKSQEQIMGIALEIEHIIPEISGGDSTETNLWLACSTCNRHKSKATHAVDQVTGQRVPLFNPRHQVWLEHFQWSDEGLIILGMTPVGRVTVDILNMNNEVVVQARRLWIAAGWHPPEE